MGSFEEFLTGQTIQISAWALLINLAIGAVFAFVLNFTYVRYGNSLSNRTILARDFFILILTTILVISVIKSSLALSLGLVGALSIVRFRAAIKEPEELAYLFLCIAVGLGLGADQRLVTTIALACIIVVVVIRKKYFSKSPENQNLYLSVSSHNPEKLSLDTIVGILNEHCSSVNLKRFDETPEVLEASFLVGLTEYESLQKISADLNKTSDSVKITFLDSQGLQ